MQWVRFLFISLWLIITPRFVNAQDDWEILLYDGAQIHTFTAQGITESRPVPTGAENIEPLSSRNWPYTTLSLSPDHTSLIFRRTFYTEDGGLPVAVLQVADLDAQICCVTIAPPFEGRADIIVIGPFSPDGTRFAVLMSRVYLNPYGGDEFAASVATFDLDTLEFVAQFSPLNTTAFELNFGVYFGEWNAAGIQFLPNCMACEGEFEGTYFNWNPDTGEITSDAGHFDLAGDILPGTGEQNIAAQSPDYPISDVPGNIEWANVIEYLPTGDIDEATIIYHDPANLMLPVPRWVLDGRAYLLHTQDGNAATLVFRDGSVRTFQLPTAVDFITATPDGWLMQGPTTGRLYYYQYGEGGLSYTEIDGVAGRVTVLDAPMLGTKITGAITPVIR